jgi:hypothetical protein
MTIFRSWVDKPPLLELLFSVLEGDAEPVAALAAAELAALVALDEVVDTDSELELSVE